MRVMTRSALEPAADRGARGSLVRVAVAVLATLVAAGPALGDAGATPSRSAPSPAAPHAQALVALRSPEGLARLARTRHKATFAALASHFEPQENRVFCGPASATIVLNALRVAEVQEPEAGGGPIPDPSAGRCRASTGCARYAQSTFFTAATDAVKTRHQVLGEPVPGVGEADYGLQLRQLDGMLRAHGLRTAPRVVDEAASVALVRREIASALLDPGTFVIANYHRPRVGQPGGGHISPIGAYDPESDSFLVIDVNPDVAPWVWVPADALVAAMRTRDVVENRGYVLVSEGSGEPHR